MRNHSESLGDFRYLQTPKLFFPHPLETNARLPVPDLGDTQHSTRFEQCNNTKVRLAYTKLIQSGIQFQFVDQRDHNIAHLQPVVGARHFRIAFAHHRCDQALVWERYVG